MVISSASHGGVKLHKSSVGGGMTLELYAPNCHVPTATVYFTAREIHELYQGLKEVCGARDSDEQSG